ncbi:MAG: hypothetical protein FWD48_05325 [Oscillospiraceae bacterium]|nr:hypothetical protein [Oscillospiraceae bacterium]
MSFLDSAFDIILIIVRAFLYILITLPLMLIEMIGDANDIMVGIQDTYPGQTIYGVVPPGVPPPIEYDGYICFDIERMNPDDKSNSRAHYTRSYEIEMSWGRGLEPFASWRSLNVEIQRPAHFGFWMLRECTPAAFYNRSQSEHRVRNYVENYVRAAYPEDGRRPGVLTIYDRLVYPETYELEGETFYYIPGDEFSRTFQHMSAQEAIDDYTRRNFYRKADFVDILPAASIDILGSNGFEKFLGPPITLLTQAQVARRASGARYYKSDWGKPIPENHKDFHEGTNIANRIMVEQGYADFNYYRGTPVFVNLKYYAYSRAAGKSAYGVHTFSLQFYYSVKPLWRAFIDNSSDYIADSSRAKSDWNRYTPNTQLWMRQNGVTPGTEPMYAGIAAIINDGRDLEPIRYIPDSYNVMEIFLTNNVINYVFWGVTLIALALCLAFSIFAVIRSMGDTTLKKPVGKVMAQTGKAMLIFLTIPTMLIVVLNLSAVSLKATSDVLDSAIAQGSGGKVTFATAILSSALTEDSQYVTAADNKGAVLATRRAMLLSGEINWQNMDEFLKYFDPLRMYFIPAVAVAWFCVVMMVFILLMFVRRLFEILMLYVAAPFCVATIPLDDGEKFKSWRNMFVSRVIMGFFSLISLKIFMIILPLIWTSGIRFASSAFFDSIFKLVFMAAGMYTAYKSQTLLTNLISAEAGEADKETSTSVAGKTVNKATGAAKKMFNYVKQERRRFRSAYQNTSEKNQEKDKKLTESFGGVKASSAKKTTLPSRKQSQDLERKERSLARRQESFDKFKKDISKLKMEAGHKTQSLEDFLK